MNRKYFALAMAFLSLPIGAASFKEVVGSLAGHDNIEILLGASSVLAQEGRIKGSWGDPVLKVSAKNFPKDSLKDDETPMTGVEIGLSQKIALTTKYGNMEKSFESLSKAKEYDASDSKQMHIKVLWELVIIKRQIIDEEQILTDNLSWIQKILKISKKHYTNGHITQQALLDIEIRKSELDGELSNKKFELLQVEDKINYLVLSDKDKLDFKTIPWSFLTKKIKPSFDFKELKFKERVKAKEFNLTAAKLNYIPDITFAIGYTKRSDLDDKGDFLGASISFPLPTSSTKYARHTKAAFEKNIELKKLHNYSRLKNKETTVLKREISKLKSELHILSSKTVRFAKNSRKITAKSYGLGNSTYIELLQSELKLQKILLKKIRLISLRDSKIVNLKYKTGAPLI